MGYLKSFSIVRHPRNLEALHELPGSLPWVVYRSTSSGDLFIDVLNFRKRRANAYPFSSLPAVQDIPLEFDGVLSELNDLYERLRRESRAGGFRRALVNLNCILSRLAGGEVLTLASDDDSLDLVAISSEGQLKRLCFDAESVEVRWSESAGVTEIPEEHGRLHRIAERECTEFLGKQIPVFGFDGDVDSLGLEVLYKSAPPPPPSPPAKKTIWQKWKERRRAK